MKPPNEKAGYGGALLVGGGIAVAGAVAAGGGGGSEPSGGSGGNGDDNGGDNGGAAPADRERRPAPEGSKNYLEGPLDTGLPGDFDEQLDRVGGGDSAAEQKIREFRTNGWQIRFTEPGTIKGETYMDWDHVNNDGLHTLWLSTDLMNLPPEELLTTIAEAIP